MKLPAVIQALITRHLQTIIDRHSLMVILEDDEEIPLSAIVEEIIDELCIERLLVNTAIDELTTLGVDLLDFETSKITPRGTRATIADIVAQYRKGTDGGSL